MERVAYCDSLTAMLKHLRALEGLTPPTPNRGDQTMTKHPGFVAHEAKEDEKPQPVRLALKYSKTDGGVVVYAVDAKGNSIVNGNIVRFEPDGSLFRFGGVNDQVVKRQSIGGRIELAD